MESERSMCWAALTLLLALFALQEGLHPQPASAISHRRRLRSNRHVKNMVFYMHDVVTAKHPTSVPVAAQNGYLHPPLKFGTTFVFDDKLTSGPHPDSTEIGRGQGLFTLASLTSPDLLFVFTVVLHKPAIYNGSTICLHGSDRIALPEREIGVVGGTGAFRFARGYAVLSTFLSDGYNGIIKFNLTMIL